MRKRRRPPQPKTGAQKKADPKADREAIRRKLLLRRYFLRRYHENPNAPRPRVFDACQGDGELWRALRHDVSVRYWGVDRKRKRGRLAVDAVEVLSQAGIAFDVIDVDTYGPPWRHWLALLRNQSPTVERFTVFLTLGHSAALHDHTGGEALEVLGLGQLARRIPRAIAWKLSEFGAGALLGVCYRYGWRVVEAKEAPPTKRERFVGLHLERAPTLERVG